MPAVGSHVPQAKNGGSWKNWSKFWAKDGGTWKRPISVYVKSGGSWVEVYDETPNVVGSITRTVTPSGSTKWANTITFTAAANGFNCTVTSLNTVSPSTITADTQVTVTATKISNFTQDYPIVTIANSSGSITVS